MPVTLVVKRRGEPELPPVSFDGPRIVIGRGSSCELRVPDASVSARHASVRASGAHWTIVDEGSTNGTRLNGEKLAVQSPRPLKTGDVLGLGRIEISVKLGAAPTSSQNATRELALQLVARSLGDATTGAAVVVREGPDAGARLELARGEPRTIGRDPRCALRLTDPAVPPIALEIALEGGRARATVRDARGKARLGDRALEERETFGWGDGALLFVGATTLVLEDPVARALDASAHGDDEKLRPESLAPPPAEPEPVAPAPVVEEPPPPPPKPERPPYDRRRSWRGATLAFEVVAVILALIVLGGSIAGLWWLLKK
ncbi:MAG: FHA domain-containing protein [Deltaproteobacteria bacterium]|nr:FHA domain-containing protein [Deltaproteobacteria bacterium]